MRNKRKLAAISRETTENTTNNQSRNTLNPEMAGAYNTQFSEKKIERRVTEKLSQEFSKTGSRILGALSEVDEFLMIPQVRTCPVAVPGNIQEQQLRKP